MNKNKDKSAFGYATVDQYGERREEQSGLTKREYMATQIAAGYVARGAMMKTAAEWSTLSIEIADELLKQLEEK
jgi:hypothetical protein